MDTCITENADQYNTTMRTSGVVFDFYCELCREDELNIEAGGYCVDCEEYLCTECWSAHRRSRPTRHHDLLDKDAMPKETPLPKNRISKDISTKCELHRSRAVELYCTMHDVLGCSLCFATVHKKCDPVCLIEEKSANILSSEEYKQLSRRLEAMEHKSEELIGKVHDNVVVSEQMTSDAVHKIRSQKKKFTDIADEIEHRLITKVETVSSEDNSRVKQLEKELVALSEEIKMMRSVEKSLLSSKRVGQLYVQMKIWKAEVARLQESLCRAEERNEIRVIVFEADEDAENDMNESTLGNIVIAKQEKEGITIATTEIEGQRESTRESNADDNLSETHTIDEESQTLDHDGIGAEQLKNDTPDSSACIDELTLEIQNIMHGMTERSDSPDKEAKYDYSPCVYEHLKDKPTHTSDEITVKEIQEPEDTTKSSTDPENVSLPQTSVIENDCVEPHVVTTLGENSPGSQKTESWASDGQDKRLADDAELVTDDLTRSSPEEAIDQQSQINPQPRKKLDRDFLLGLQFDTSSTCRPDDLPDVSNINFDNVLDETEKTVNLDTRMKVAQSARSVVDIKAYDIDMEKPNGEEEIYRFVTDSLSSLTPHTFKHVVLEMQSLPIKTETVLKGVADIIYEKAISGPNCSLVCANLCRCLSMFRVPSEKKPEEGVTLRAVILTRVQRAFEKDPVVAPDQEQKREVKHETPRYLGIIRFMGDIFKMKMLTDTVMHDCIYKLLRSKHAICFEAVCILLSSIGSQLDVEKAKPRMNQYFRQMQILTNDEKIPKTVRSKLQNVIDLRLNKWISHRKDNMPVTDHQVHKKKMPEFVFRGSTGAAVPVRGGFGRGRAGFGSSPSVIRTIQFGSVDSPLTRRGGTARGASVTEVKSSTTPPLKGPWNALSTKLKALIVDQQADNKTVKDWINSTVLEEYMKESMFIRVLVNRICHYAVRKVAGSSRRQLVVKPELITSRLELLQTYIGRDRQLELEALYALQSLFHKLGSPPGVLRQMFDVLRDNDVISEDAFMSWKSSKTMPEGKLAALNDVEQFFLMITFKRLLGGSSKE